MIDRRLSLMLAAAIGLGGYSMWSGDNPLVDWLYPQSGIATAVNQPARIAASATPTEKVANLNPLALLDAAAFEELVRRPLFNPTRAPAPPPEPQPEPEPEPEVVVAEEPPPTEEPAKPEDFALLGIASKDGEWTVVMRWNPSNEIHRLKTGGEIQGWSLTDVAAQKVTLSRDGQLLDIKMFLNTAPPQALANNPEDHSQDADVDPAEMQQSGQQMDPRRHIQTQ